MQYILQTKHLTKTLDGRTIVQDVNIHMKKGEIYGFLGPNGAGKTSVMKMLTNLWKPTDGSVELFGERLTPSSYGILKRMGSIIEFPVFYEQLSGAENLRLHCEYMGYYSPQSVENALELLKLSDAADRQVKQYSLGMKQRLGIARAVLSKPELLILDEPTNGLDPAGMKQIRELLKMLCREYHISIMVSTHILSEIESIADVVGVIHKGRMLREAPMAEITEKQTAYLELCVGDVRRAAYLLAERLHLTNFRIVDGRVIRVYEKNAEPSELSRVMADGGVAVSELKSRTEKLEDYFLRMTGEEGAPWES